MTKREPVHIDSPEQLDFSKLAHEQIVFIAGVKYETKVSKGRKMLQYDNVTSVEKQVSKKIKGWVHPQDRYHRDTTMIMDYRNEPIQLKSRSWYPSESYDLPNGQISANRWDVYEFFKFN